MKTLEFKKELLNATFKEWINVSLPDINKTYIRNDTTEKRWLDISYQKMIIL